MWPTSVDVWNGTASALVPVPELHFLHSYPSSLLSVRRYFCCPDDGSASCHPLLPVAICHCPGWTDRPDQQYHHRWWQVGGYRPPPRPRSWTCWKHDVRRQDFEVNPPPQRRLQSLPTMMSARPPTRQQPEHRLWLAWHRKSRLSCHHRHRRRLYYWFDSKPIRRVRPSSSLTAFVFRSLTTGAKRPPRGNPARA